MGTSCVALSLLESRLQRRPSRSDPVARSKKMLAQSPKGNDPLNGLAPEKARLVRNGTQHLARMLLTATFLEDAWRICFDYNSQMNFLTNNRGMNWFVASLVLFLSVVVQFGGSVLLVGQQKMEWAA